MFRGRGSIPDLFSLVDLTERFGWTLDQILEQPDWYITAIYAKLKADADHAKRSRE